MFDTSGKMLRANFEAQTRQSFANLAEILGRENAQLSDIVTMMVHIADTRYVDRFIELRHEFFTVDSLPASTLITTTGFAKPEMLIEITPIAVIGESRAIIHHDLP